MGNNSDNKVKEPIGRIMGNISKKFLLDINKRLSHLDIMRSYFPLLLIEAGEGNMIQQDLAEVLSCDKVQVVRIIDYLSSKGYVKRGQNSGDRRKYNLEITGKAKKMIPEIRKALNETTDLALRDIPDEKIEELYDLLKKIASNLVS